MGWLFRYGRGLERGLMARLGGLVMKGRGWLGGGSGRRAGRQLRQAGHLLLDNRVRFDGA